MKKRSSFWGVSLEASKLPGYNQRVFGANRISMMSCGSYCRISIADLTGRSFCLDREGVTLWAHRRNHEDVFLPCFSVVVCLKAHLFEDFV